MLHAAAVDALRGTSLAPHIGGCVGKNGGIIMRNRRSHASFVENLRRKVRSLKKMRSGDVHVFTINANYGNYQIVIGPAKGHNHRNLEITGEIHHLFVSPDSIRPNPSKHQIYKNLKDTIIMRNLEVHLMDPIGDGRHLMMKDSEAHPREYINLAGRNGELLMRHMESGRRLTQAAYKIIQKDILRALEDETTRE